MKSSPRTIEPPEQEPVPDEWEGLCKQCGLCCLEKTVEEDGTIVVHDAACRFLDLNDMLCRIYEFRFQACSDCLPVTRENIAELVWLPDTCGYVEYMNELHGSDSWRNSAKVVWPWDDEE